MADTYNASRIGQDNLSGATDALFPELYSSAVFMQLMRKSIMLPFLWSKNTRGAKSDVFPYMGRVPDPVLHSAGQELDGQQVAHSNKTITLDRPIVSHQFVDMFDEMLNNFDVKNPYVKEAANAIAKVVDQHALAEVILGARQSAGTPVTGAPGGTVITNSDLGAATPSTQAMAWFDELYNAQVALEENDYDVSAEGAIAVVTPAIFNTLKKAVQSSGFAIGHGDYKNSRIEGRRMFVGDIEVLKSNNMGSGSADYDGVARDYSADSSLFRNHQGNFSTSVGVVFAPQAVGRIVASDMATKVSTQDERLGTLLVTYLFQETGWLIPELLVELKTA
jgi:hypothetical protein